MIGLAAAGLAGYGTFLLYTAMALGWRGLGAGAVRRPKTTRRSFDEWLRQAGMGEVAPAQFLAAVAILSVFGAVLSYALFGGVLPAIVAGVFAGSFPVASYRARRQRRLASARETWPRMLEELRLLTGSLGRSIPQALFDVGRRAPVELRPAFAAAEREWLLTTDFARTAAVLRHRLADPTADVVAETLTIAHEVGGTDLDRRLAELIDDRILDLQGRKEAETEQAGVRFARRFVLLVPLGMALAGLSIGNGRAAYQTVSGQAAVAVGLLAVVLCWVWSGRLMRLPEEPRVFIGDGTSAERGAGGVGQQPLAGWRR